jgi:hypothetical protein
MIRYVREGVGEGVRVCVYARMCVYVCVLCLLVVQ